jgi:hypothetical protein
MKVLLIAPNIDGTDVGEAFVAYKWAEALAELVDLTVLSFHRAGRTPLADQLPKAQVVTWDEPPFLVKRERLNAMLKPGWPLFSRHVRKWMKSAAARGEKFGVAHQLMPQAARYATPLRHSPVPYVIGPLGGALNTPPAFAHETGGAPLFTKLRKLDAFRLSHDPFLRASYAKAALVLGVAPYMADVLGDIALRRFEPVLELGIEALADPVERQMGVETLKLLHVGRGVRTKGLRDVVRALAQLKDRPGITLTSAGAGEELDASKAEAEKLGVSERVTFLGRIPREEVENLYRTHDVFAFPSFREPAGGVLYEAMRWGLPIVTARRGGPEWIVDDNCGMRMDISTPEALTADLAKAFVRLADNPDLRARLGAGAREKVEREGLWPRKAEALVRLYQGIADITT